MSASSEEKSTKADANGDDGGRQGSVASAAFGRRLREAMEKKALNQAGLARATGLPKQRVADYYRGKKTPGADTVFAIADALGVEPRWLVREEGPRFEPAPRTAPDDWILLPRYDLFAFADGGAFPEPVEMAPVRRCWLTSTARTVKGLWLAEMPSDAMPEIAREGGLVVCREPDLPLADGRVYAFLLDRRPIVRRVQVRPEGLLLKAGDPTIDPIALTPEALEQLTPIGRVVAAITLQPV